MIGNRISGSVIRTNCTGKLGAITFVKFLLVSLIVLFGGSFAHAEVSATATVDSNRVALGEALTYTISVETNDSVSIGSPRLPDLDGFNILNKFDGVSSRSTFVNGQFQFVQTYQFSFVLAPTRQGKLTLGVAEVVVGSETFKTKPIAIDVLAPGAGGSRGGGGPQAQQGRGQQAPADPLEEDPFFSDADDLFNQLLKRRGLGNPGGTKTQPVNPDEAFFIQVEVDKSDVYEGEQVTTSFYLMTPYQVRDIDTLKYPSLKGFWKEDIEVATRLNFQREIVNGVPYNKALLASYALFPIKAGKAVVDSYKAKCTIVTQANMLGMGTPYQYTKASLPVNINVKPLPKESQPGDFSGAVGKFSLSAKVDSGSKVSVNQPFTLKVRLEGRGNAKVVELPTLNLPPDLELYDTKADAKFFRDGQGYKEWDVLLIPRRGGAFTLPAVSISSFDPEQGRFVQSKTDAITVQVGEGRPGETYQAAPLADGPKADKPESGRAKDLPPPLTEISAGAAAVPQVWMGVWALLTLLTGGGLFWKARRELGWGERKRGLRERLRGRLGRAGKLVGDFRKFGAEGINTINMVLGELSKDGSADANFERLILKAPPSVRRELEADLRKLVSYFESLAFAPEAMASQMASESKSQLRELDRVLMKCVDLGDKE